MAKKQTKRSRKFEQSGGVKGRLQKGTITNKGKLKQHRKGKRRAGEDDNDRSRPTKKRQHDALSPSEEIRRKRSEEDFTSSENLGDLDMDSFFENINRGIENETIGMDEVSSNDEDRSASEDESGSESDENQNVDGDGDNDGAHDTKKQTRPNSTSKPLKKPQSTREDSSDDNSGSSDSEDEDVEASEMRMKREMANLSSKDPEFHEFLKENEQALLTYGEDDDSDDGSNSDDDDIEEDDLDRNSHPRRQGDNDEEDDEPLESSSDRGVTLLTMDVLEKLERGAFKSHGVKGLKRFVNAYKSACHMADSANDKDKKVSGKKYHIESSDVFDRLMVSALNNCCQEFHYHLLGKGSPNTKTISKKTDDSDDDEEESDLPVDDNKPINPGLLEKSEKWNDVKPTLFAFLKSTMHVVSEAKEPDLVTYILKALSKCIPLMTPYPRLAESMLKTMISLWSAPIDASEDYQVVRLHAFLRIRQMALTQPFPFIEECLKKAYLAYAQRAKFANASSVTSTLPTLTFMGNCVVEMYSLDYHSSYQHAFVYIRQLALLLRTAMQKKTPEAFSAVYCWQYLHCLKLWVAVLTEAYQSRNDDDPAASASPAEEQLLHSLLFPLSQVVLGAVRLIPSTRYLPLRLHCVRLLQQLAAAAEVFLPTTSILLEVFDLRELSLQPKKIQKGAVPSLALTFRLRKENPLRTMEELEMCVSEVFVLLNREADLYQYSAGFPEFSVRICQRLRKV